jgi:hypothetical protein
VKRQRTDENDDLGLPWDKLADGLPHRLKRKRDFPNADQKAVQKAATKAAKKMEKVVRVVPDKMSRNRDDFLWVQFADYQINLGEPCRCGGRQILRFHEYFGRCVACNAQLILVSPDTVKSKVEDIYEWDGNEYGW